MVGRMGTCCWRIAALAWLVASLPLPVAAWAQEDPIAQAAAERWALDQAYRQRLAELAALCRKLDLAEQAEATAAWFPIRDPRRQYVFLPPPIDPLKPAEDAPTIVQQWYARLTRERQQRAEELFQLAQRQLQRDASVNAYQLLHEVLHEDPDHVTARQTLGYRQVGDRWQRPSARIRVRQVRGAQPSLGITSGPYHVIESEHFSIATTHSEAAGRQLAERLELLHSVWRQLFFPFWSNTAALRRRLESTAVLTGGGGARHNVVLFRDREQYVSALKPVEPLIEMTTGFYQDQRRIAYFFAEDQPNPNVFDHEVTHQLFAETGRATAEIGRDSDFWIVEGIALYMESLQQGDGYCTVGGIDADWLQFARYRALHERFHVPLDQLILLGRRDLQEHPEIRRLYSQSAGLTAMLMDDRDGFYRPALLEYLQAVYAGRTRSMGLEALVGEPLAALDDRYRHFLEVTDQDLAFLSDMPMARRLSLGRTAVTDAGLQHLAGHVDLNWLDLTGTAIGDEGLAHLSRATKMNQLALAQTRVTDRSMPLVGTFAALEILDLSGTPVSDQGFQHLAGLARMRELWIEQTRITDASLPLIGTLRSLQILDLSGTAITEQGLQHLAGLSELRELWLTRTSVGDTGLEHLRSLKKLEVLDLGDTRVTAQGRQRLRSVLPSLED
jgi:hypothetical protein